MKCFPLFCNKRKQNLGISPFEVIRICSHFLFYTICKSGGDEDRIFEYLRYEKRSSTHDQEIRKGQAI